MLRVPTSSASKVVQSARPKKEIRNDQRRRVVPNRRVETHSSLLSHPLRVSEPMPARKCWSNLRRARARDNLRLNLGNNKENCQQSPGLPEVNCDLPCTSSTLKRLLDLETARKDDYKCQLHNDRRKLKRSRASEVTMRLKVSKAGQSLGEVQERVTRAEERINKLRREKNALRMRKSRDNDSHTRALQKERVTSLKEKGVIGDAARTMVRDLASLNVPVEHVGPVIDAVAKAVGVTITDSLGPRSVGRIVLEGKVAGDIQLIHEMRTAKSKFVNKYVVSGTNYIP